MYGVLWLQSPVSRRCLCRLFDDCQLSIDIVLQLLRLRHIRIAESETPTVARA